MRRLPFYILIDNSSSMVGEPIEQVNAGLSMLLSTLKENPYALESVYLRIHSYSKDTQTILPLIALEAVQFHNLTCAKFVESNLGKSLEELALIIKTELNQGSFMSKAGADWSPLLLLITQGKITDLKVFNEVLPKIKKLNFADILILKVGDKEQSPELKAFSKKILQIDTMSSRDFEGFFNWVSLKNPDNNLEVLEPKLDLNFKKTKKFNFPSIKNLIIKKKPIIETRPKINLEKSSITKENKIIEEDNLEQKIKEEISKFDLIHNANFRIKKIAISFVYDEIFEFKEGRAKVRYKWKYGFIDTQGREVIPLIYDKLYDFHEGLAAFCINGKWGFIDRNGKERIPALYTKVNSFHNGLAAVNKLGKGLFISNGKWGFIDYNGMEIIPTIYDEVADFSEDLAAVSLNNKYGFINKQGEEFYPLVYDLVKNFKEGLALVCEGNSWKILNKIKNDLVDTLQFYDNKTTFYDFAENLALFRQGQKYGFINKLGMQIIPPIHDFAGNFKQGVAFINYNNRWGLIDKYSSELVFPHYDGVNLNYSFNENLAAVNIGGTKRNFLFFTGGQWGFINLQGELVIPLQYDFARNFSCGLALVNKGGSRNNEGFVSGGNSGFINHLGETIIPLKYDEARDFKEDIAVLRKADNWYLVIKEYI